MLREFYETSITYEDWQLWPNQLRRLMPVSLGGLILATILSSNITHHLHTTGAIVTGFTWLVIIISAISHIIPLYNMKQWVSHVTYQQMAVGGYVLSLCALMLAELLAMREITIACGHIAFVMIFACAALVYERPN